MSDVARDLFGDCYPVVEHYVDILATRGVEWGLIGPRERDRLWDRHILNCAAVSSLVPEGSSVVDVGSGAGLPGIPLALLRPDLSVTLLEPLLRRFKFLTHTVDELGITDTVAVLRGRAEDQFQRYDAVICRALAPLARLVSWCSPLMTSGGVILALKGNSVRDEVTAAADALAARRLTAAVLVVRAHAAAEPATVVRIHRLTSVGHGGMPL